MLENYLVVKSLLGGEDLTFFNQFHSTLDELSLQGLELDVTDRQESSTQVRLKYSDPNERLSITICDDYITETRYLEVRSEDESLSKLANDLLNSHVEIEEPSELLKEADERMVHEPRIIGRLAFATPSRYDKTFFEVISRAIRNDIPDLRKYGAFAAGVLGWKEFIPILANQTERERPGEVKSYLDRALDLCEG